MSEKRKAKVLKQVLKWIQVSERRGGKVKAIRLESYSTDPWRRIKEKEDEFGNGPMERVETKVSCKVNVSSVKELLQVWDKVSIMSWVSYGVDMEDEGNVK